MMDFVTDNWKEVTAFAVILYCFIKQQNFLNKDLRGDLKEMTTQLKQNGETIKKDAENTEELKKVIGNHLVHSVDKLGDKIDQLGDKIEKWKE